MTTTSAIKSGKSPYKKTDHRHTLWVKARQDARIKAMGRSFRVNYHFHEQPSSKHCVTVDTSNARNALDVLRMCLKELKWRELPSGRRDGTCHIQWNNVHFKEGNKLTTAEKVNKFPGMVEVLRKVNLGRTLDVMQQLFPEAYDFYPQQWYLPQQFPEFISASRKLSSNGRKPVFIVKPDEGCQGEGIYLISDPKDFVFNHRSYVVQEYLSSPLLLDELKFDLRVYVVVTSLDPLKIYLSREGLARFCTVPYEPPTSKNLCKTYMHLTNYSLNKKSENYRHTESSEDGSKRTMSCVFGYLRELGYDVEQLCFEIEQLVVKTMIAIMPDLKVYYRSEVPLGQTGPSCFQILGFDILLLSDGKPMLLEVNSNPSLRIDYEREVLPGIFEYIYSQVDTEIKKPLVHDTLLLVAPRTYTARCHSRNKAKTKANEDSQSVEALEQNGLDELCVNERPAPPPPSEDYEALELVYPHATDYFYDELFILNAIASIFIDCLGVRGSLRMGTTAFRTFTRRCKLVGCQMGFTNAEFDILFINLQKRWEHLNLDRPGSGLRWDLVRQFSAYDRTYIHPTSQGLCFLAFVEAFLTLAQKKFDLHKSESTVRLVDLWREQKLTELARQKRSKHLPLISKATHRSPMATNSPSAEWTAMTAISNPRRYERYRGCFDFRNQKLHEN